METEQVERFGITNYKNISERFTAEKSDFSKQYYNIYKVRLDIMRNILAEQIAKRWNDSYQIYELHKLPEDDSKCIVIGTLFKDQKLKPSILKQLAETNSLIPQPVYTHFTDDSDSLYLEDELQRIQIIGDLNVKKLVTGITCALLGFKCTNDKFQVDDYCFADLRPQIKRSLTTEDLYVVFVSGLNFVDVRESYLRLRILVDWLTGILGNIHDIDVRRIARLVIAGNSIQTKHVKNHQTTSLISRAVEVPEALESVKILDSFLKELSISLSVDIMPGEHDPSNHILPQAPMHHCMFPKAMKMRTVNQVSNPYECVMDDVQILGTSGEPIKSILGFSNITDELEALEMTLKWSHLAPTAPDTLGCYPFYENDPFVIKQCPHVIFAGNQNKFATKLIKGNEGQEVRLICVPQFTSSGTVALLNLKNLECQPIVFN